MLIPIKQREIDRLIPSVATGGQFGAALGDPRKILQRVMISSIGGVITLLIGQSQVASQFYYVWLILGVVFLFYILWGPILEASRKNSTLKGYSFAALFDGEISNVYTEERVINQHEQADNQGQLELVKKKRTLMTIELEDNDGYLGKISFPFEKKYSSIRNGLRITCVVFSNYKDFAKISNVTDAWLPNVRIWVGDYPYLLRPAFEEYCSLRLKQI